MGKLEKISVSKDKPAFNLFLLFIVYKKGKYLGNNYLSDERKFGTKANKISYIISTTFD